MPENQASTQNVPLKMLSNNINREVKYSWILSLESELASSLHSDTVWLSDNCLRPLSSHGLWYLDSSYLYCFGEQSHALKKSYVKLFKVSYYFPIFLLKL